MSGVAAFHELRRPAVRLRAVAAAAAVLAAALVLAIARPGALGVALVVAGLAAFLWWTWVSRYELRVADGELRVGLLPLRKRTVPLAEVQGCVAHMAYPWGEDRRGPKQVDGVETYRLGAGAGLVVELADGSALWLDCAHPEALAGALRPPRRRRQKAAAAVS